MKKTMRTKVKIAVVVLFSLLLVVLFLEKADYFSKSRQELGDSSKKEKIRFANVFSYGSSLVNIALEKKFFEEENIDLEISLHNVGKLAMEDMFANKSDFSFAAQTPIVAASFERQDFKIVASIASSPNLCKIIARKDKGISKAIDLKGKKINGTKGTALEHFLNIYLDKNNVDKKDVILSTLDLKDAIPMLLNGEIDGIVAQEPITMDIAGKLGDNGIILEEPGLYSTNGVLLVSDEFIKRSPNGVEKFLKALKKASEYYDKDTLECKQFLATYHKMDFKHIEKLMKEYELRPTLKNTFLLNIENESRTMIANGLTGNKPRPNYLDFIFEAPLKKVLPHNVNIIR
jgi:NitT/TauT family transport system substrate-binding protein